MKLNQREDQTVLTRQSIWVITSRSIYRLESGDNKVERFTNAYPRHSVLHLYSWDQYRFIKPIMLQVQRAWVFLVRFWNLNVYSLWIQTDGIHIFVGLGSIESMRRSEDIFQAAKDITKSPELFSWTWWTSQGFRPDITTWDWWMLHAGCSDYV